MRELWQEVEVLSGSNFDGAPWKMQSLGKFKAPLFVFANYVFYCTICGEIYGLRRPILPYNAASWHYVGFSCRDHATINRFEKEGGGFLISLLDDIEALPRPLMLHDLEVASYIWKQEYESNCASELAAFAAYAKLKADELKLGEYHREGASTIP